MDVRFILAITALVMGCAGEDPQKIASSAINASDQSLCLDITDPRMRNNCSSAVAEVSDNITMCKEIGDREWRNHCITRIASHRKDYKVCEEIPMQRSMDSCLKAVGT